PALTEPGTLVTRLSGFAACAYADHGTRHHAIAATTRQMTNQREFIAYSPYEPLSLPRAPTAPSNLSGSSVHTNPCTARAAHQRTDKLQSGGQPMDSGLYSVFNESAALADLATAARVPRCRRRCRCRASPTCFWAHFAPRAR